MLNLPETVLFNDGHETRYTYAADGRKLRVEYRLNNFAIIDAPGEGIEIGGGGIFNPQALSEVTEELVDDSGDIPAIEEPMFTTLMVRDYCGNHIYRNGVLERVLTDNGYIEDGEMFFYVKDYQGNVRVVLDQNNQLVELNSYYPYGSLMAATTAEGVQSRKYGAKELDRENGLDWYDFEARMLMSNIGRTTTMDPLAEKYYSTSPYAWCAGNPVKFIDPTGKIIENKNNIGFQYHFKDAINYIGEEFKVIYNRLKEDPKITFVIIDYNGDNPESLKRNSVTTTQDESIVKICIDLSSAVELENGDIVSPALIAFHEFGHADGARENLSEYRNNIRNHDSGNFSNKEEERNIRNNENPVAKKLGEPIRDSDKYKEYIHTDDVTFHKKNN